MKVSITLPTDAFKNELKNVGLITAREISENKQFDDENIKKFYITSGLKLLFETLMNNAVIRDNIDALFLENSTIISTMQDNKLDAFTLAWKNDSVNNSNSGLLNPFIENVERNFKNIIIELRDKNEVIFNHPDFLIKAENVNTFFSILHLNNKTTSHLIISDKKLRNRKRLMNAYFNRANKFYKRFHETYTIDQNSKPLQADRLQKHITKLKGKPITVYFKASEISSSTTNYDYIKSNETLNKYKKHSKDPYPLHLLNHYLYNDYFLQGGNIGKAKIDFTERMSIFISLPLLGATAKEDEKGELYEGLGAAFVFILLKQNQYSEYLIKRIRNALTKTCQIYSLGINSFTHGYTAYIYKQLNKKVIDNATKSAIAAIMARNMSHNLGSHVFYYTRNQINAMSEVEDNIQHKSDLKGLSWFLHYVQERQDFVATVTSQDDYYMGPLNLKMDVLDEITPDAVDRRHNSEPPSTNFILKHIVNSEGLTRQVKIGKEKNTSSLDDIEIELIANKVKFKSWDNSKKAKKFYDLDIAVKGGQQSRHAFLIILENIIRNAAKHGYVKGNTYGLKISIKIAEKKDKGIYLIEIHDNCLNGKESVPKIKSFLKDLKILSKNDYQTINRECKGLKEIVVCIAWLKGEPLSEVFKESLGIKKGILDIKEKNGNLCYSFELPKFSPIIEIDNGVIEDLRNFRKHGQIYLCKNNSILNLAIRHFPHATRKIEGENYWEIFAKNKLNDANKELPLIIFERDGCKFIKNGFFAFVSKETQIADAAEGRKFIVFRNHLKKSTDSLKEYFETIEIIGSEQNSPLFIDNLSGATFAFNLFQKTHPDKNLNEKDKVETYYKIIESFYTRIILVDERLCPVNDIEDELIGLTNSPDKVEPFVKKYLISNHLTYIDRFNKIIATANKKEVLKELLACWESLQDNTKQNVNAYDPDFKYVRKFYERQNTLLFNMNFQGDLLGPDGSTTSDLSGFSPHFFSIHVGLLDKLNSGLSDNSTTGKLFYLKKHLRIPNNTFISVHSGRGGLTDKQKRVTFIPFANLQWSLENCKFKLSELFYNQIYFPID